MPWFGRGRSSEASTRTPVARVTVGVATHLGKVRPDNEDHFAFLFPEDEESLATRGALLCVADGMGGHASGALASQLAVDALLDTYFGALLDRGIAEALRAGYQAANRRVFETGNERPGSEGMGTTLVTLVLHESHLWIANVGDSRALLFRQGRLQTLTRDHTVAQELIDRGAAEANGAAAAALGHQLTRCIGFDEGEWEPDITECEVVAGDVLLLASDGLTGTVDATVIAEVLRMGPSPSAGAHLLVERALASGGRDNITVVWARIDSLQ
jgi:PPM family protein phosphatase